MIASTRRLRSVVFIGLILTLVCAVYPVHSRLIQLGLASGVVLLWGGLYGLRPWGRVGRVILVVVVCLAVVPFMLPAKPLDADVLRGDYVSRLRGFSGVRYVWGGESHLGIDCSGLPRMALRDALWSAGIRDANGGAFRMWLGEWWYDSSALAMLECHRGRTASPGIEGALWNLDMSKLMSGDLAIRDDGVHVVVYLGDGEWIEAEPTRGKVRVWRSTPNDGAWYESLQVRRWSVLRIER